MQHCSLQLSVIICTHNPRPDYLRRTLDALKAQTFRKEQWELLLVDNASKEPFAAVWDLTWHPHARVIRENELGLTHARLRGIRESNCDLIVFVDDDNVLEPNYLEQGISIAKLHPWLGAFNGSTIGEFEHDPHDWVRFVLPNLAIREVKTVEWACQPGTRALGCAPCGAGMVIRRHVALAYLNKVKDDPLRISLDRSGRTLGAAGDSDMALCSCEMGLAVGLFPELSLKHLIPPSRLESDYLIRLAEGMSRSHAILRYIWDGELPKTPESVKPCRSERLLRAYQAFRLRLSATLAQQFRAEIQAASLRGEFQAAEMLAHLERRE